VEVGKHHGPGNVLCGTSRHIGPGEGVVLKF
jgi:hypothetical protein